MEIYSDASGFGYGSTWDGVEVQGLFTECQKSLSINTKELLAIYYALGAHAEKWTGEVVMVRCDNTTAISCIKNCGSSDFLRDKITGYIFELAFKHNFEIRISYVQSADNCLTGCPENLNLYMLNGVSVIVISRPSLNSRNFPQT